MKGVITDRKGALWTQGLWAGGPCSVEDYPALAHHGWKCGVPLPGSRKQTLPGAQRSCQNRAWQRAGLRVDKGPCQGIWSSWGLSPALPEGCSPAVFLVLYRTMYICAHVCLVNPDTGPGSPLGTRGGLDR